MERPGTEVSICDPSTEDAEAGGSEGHQHRGRSQATVAFWRPA